MATAFAATLRWLMSREQLSVQPALNRQNGNKYAYNDARTWYDREHAFLLSEIMNYAHWNDKHLQDTDWTEYHADWRLLNGRSWPDTIQPNINVPATMPTLFNA